MQYELALLYCISMILKENAVHFCQSNDQQIREKVYNALLQWSQNQQATPLQPWPAIPAEAKQSPNFYLYNYLCHGSKQDLAQTTQTYGKETIEPIYLQSNAEGETEVALLEVGIYQSYDLQTDFQSCMQEMVETFFLLKIKSKPYWVISRQTPIILMSFS